LSTIGRKGPSSFIFEPEYNSFTAEDLKNFRQELGLTTRDFAECFGITQATIVRIENGQTSGNEVLKLLEIFYLFPSAAEYYVRKYGKKLHYKTEERVVNKCWTDILTTDEYIFSKKSAKKLEEVEWAENVLKDIKIKNALNVDIHSDLYKIREAKAALFELRFAYAIHNAGLTAKYEFKTGQGNSSIDFFVDDPKTQKKWLFELTSLSTGDAVRENTYQDGNFTSYLSISSLNKNSPEVREVIKVQNAIFSKICNEDGKPIKFPEPTPNCYNVIVVDTRSFNSGISDLDDYKLIAYGNKDVYESHRQYWIDQNGQRNDIKGVFDNDHPDLRSKYIQERIHAIAFIEEKIYSDGEINNKDKNNKYCVEFLTNPKLTKKELWPLSLD
jgi:transcriptional regulator with XRE-family HTH domain